MPEVCIALSALTKAYPIYKHPIDRVKETFHPWRKKYHHLFYALRDISFSIRSGETLGVIGRNGSGKSTLLQLISQVIQPTSGDIYVQGKTAALLELGAGFNPEFTGKDNLYMNASILGLSSGEIDRRYNSIVDFAGIGEFIDQPVKVYSSGMMVRLAFAVIAHVEAEIWVIDEALSVGDEAFQRKCFATIQAFKEKGNTLIFVSHSPQTVVELCDRAILLEGGKLLVDDSAKTAVREYHRLLFSQEQVGSSHGGLNDNPRPRKDPIVQGAEKNDKDAEDFFDPKLVSRSCLEYATKGARISHIQILNTDKKVVNTIQPNTEYVYAYDVEFLEDCLYVVFGGMIKTTTGLELGGFISHPLSKPLPKVKKGVRLRVEFSFYSLLIPGVYFVNAGVTGSYNKTQTFLHRIVDAGAFRVQAREGLLNTGIVNFTLGKPPRLEFI